MDYISNVVVSTHHVPSRRLRQRRGRQVRRLLQSLLSAEPPRPQGPPHRLRPEARLHPPPDRGRSPADLPRLHGGEGRQRRAGRGERDLLRRMRRRRTRHRLRREGHDRHVLLHGGPHARGHRHPRLRRPRRRRLRRVQRPHAPEQRRRHTHRRIRGVHGPVRRQQYPARNRQPQRHALRFRPDSQQPRSPGPRQGRVLLRGLRGADHRRDLQELPVLKGGGGREGALRPVPGLGACSPAQCPGRCGRKGDGRGAEGSEGLPPVGQGHDPDRRRAAGHRYLRRGHPKDLRLRLLRQRARDLLPREVRHARLHLARGLRAAVGHRGRRRGHARPPELRLPG